MAEQDYLPLVDELVGNMPPITLEQMKVIKLMNRIDKKYMINLRQLPLLLRMAADDYFVQETGGRRRFLYRSCYYDTPGADMYLMHCNGKLTRQKIRVREYVYSNLTFLEIKNKNNKGRTSKIRIQVPNTNISAQNEAREYVDLKSNYLMDQIAPRLSNQFHRITLVNKGLTERLTIDIGITFKNWVTGRQGGNPNLCIVELKRDGNVPSPFLDYFSRLRIKAKGISKYCFGMMLTDPMLKRNRFLPKLHYIDKITGPAQDLPLPPSNG